MDDGRPPLRVVALIAGIVLQTLANAATQLANMLVHYWDDGTLPVVPPPAPAALAAPANAVVEPGDERPARKPKGLIPWIKGQQEGFKGKNLTTEESARQAKLKRWLNKWKELTEAEQEEALEEFKQSKLAQPGTTTDNEDKALEDAELAGPSGVVPDVAIAGGDKNYKVDSVTGNEPQAAHEAGPSKATVDEEELDDEGTPEDDEEVGEEDEDVGEPATAAEQEDFDEQRSMDLDEGRNSEEESLLKEEGESSAHGENSLGEGWEAAAAAIGPEDVAGVDGGAGKAATTAEDEESSSSDEEESSSSDEEEESSSDDKDDDGAEAAAAQAREVQERQRAEEERLRAEEAAQKEEAERAEAREKKRKEKKEKKKDKAGQEEDDQLVRKKKKRWKMFLDKQ